MEEATLRAVARQALERAEVLLRAGTSAEPELEATLVLEGKRPAEVAIPEPEATQAVQPHYNFSPRITCGTCQLTNSRSCRTAQISSG